MRPTLPVIRVTKAKAGTSAKPAQALDVQMYDVLVKIINNSGRLRSRLDGCEGSAGTFGSAAGPEQSVTTVYNRADFEQAHVRLRSAPDELTMADVEQLATFGGADLGRDALAARKAALFPAPAVQAPPQRPATKGGLSQASIEAIAEAVVTFVAEHIKPILARLRAIEQDRDKGVASVRWRGVFKHGETFRSGELATHKGSLWVCQRDTGQTPGRPADGHASDWILIVKSGSIEARS